jgi:membrane-associated phospholipid phosphatase
MLVALYRSKKAFGYCFLPLALLIFVSTVYGWFHYVTDVAAGIALAGIVMAVAPRVQALLTSGTLRLRLPELRYVAAEESAP